MISRFVLGPIGHYFVSGGPVGVLVLAGGSSVNGLNFGSFGGFWAAGGRGCLVSLMAQ